MDAKDWAPWVGIVVSLAWNAFNSYTAKQQWRRGHALTEFKALKTPVDVELNKLRASKAKIKALELSGGSAEDFASEVKTLNMALSEEFNGLVVSLEPLDTSNHSIRQNWVEKANEDWDQFVSAYDRLYAPKTVEARKPVLVAAVSKIEQLIDGIHKALEEELGTKTK